MIPAAALIPPASRCLQGCCGRVLWGGNKRRGHSLVDPLNKTRWRRPCAFISGVCMVVTEHVERCVGSVGLFSSGLHAPAVHCGRPPRAHSRTQSGACLRRLLLPVVQ